MTTDRPNAVFRDVVSRDVIAAILRIHFPDDPTIADLTWGKGAFWSGDEWVLGMDITPRYGAHVQADARHVPLRDGAVDLAVFDPPFMGYAPKSQDTRSTTVQLFSDYGAGKNQPDVRRLYIAAVSEIRRIARAGAIIKCADIVEGGKFNPTCSLLVNAFQPILGLPEDIAILDSGVVRPTRHARVLHLRQAHSYFLVYKWR